MIKSVVYPTLANPSPRSHNKQLSFGDVNLDKYNFKLLKLAICQDFGQFNKSRNLKVRLNVNDKAAKDMAGRIHNELLKTIRKFRNRKDAVLNLEIKRPEGSMFNQINASVTKIDGSKFMPELKASADTIEAEKRFLKEVKAFPDRLEQINKITANISKNSGTIEAVI